ALVDLSLVEVLEAVRAVTAVRTLPIAVEVAVRTRGVADGKPAGWRLRTRRRRRVGGEPRAGRQRDQKGEGAGARLPHEGAAVHRARQVLASEARQLVERF